MANREHVAVVKQGAAALTEYRQRQQPSETLDFSDADLTGVDLSDLRLVGADLRQANLSDANLARADLRGANAERADLTGANLYATDLSHANLSAADLWSTILWSTRLNGTSLTNASVFLSVIAGCDLSSCGGLSTVKHMAPSSIGLDTLTGTWRGAGNRWTPELLTFFTGAGVPRELLNSIPGILAEVKYQSAFISYGGPDAELARRLHGDLTNRGVRCWTYELSATPGEKTWPEIKRSLLGADKVIVLCSARSLVRAGVRKELEEVIDEAEDKLMPVSLDNAWKEAGFEVRRDGRNLKPYLTERNYADFSDHKAYEAQLERLLRGLRRPESLRKPRKGVSKEKTPSRVANAQGPTPLAPPSSSFWQPKSIEELAKEQGVKPVRDWSKFSGGWPKNEDFAAFEKAVQSAKSDD